jgi:hypothetical protein
MASSTDSRANVCPVIYPAQERALREWDALSQRAEAAEGERDAARAALRGAALEEPTRRR